MATGMPPRYTETSNPDGEKHRVLMLALYTAQELEWDVQYLSKNGIIAFTQNQSPAFNAQIKVIVSDHNMKVISASTGHEYFDLGKNKKTVGRFMEKFTTLKSSYNNELLDSRYAEIEGRLWADENDILLQAEPASLELFSDLLALFKPSGQYFVTPMILNINLLIYLIMIAFGADLMSPDGDTLLQWGANYRPAVEAGEYWRLFTCCFIHIGVLHLLLNMYALIYVGILIEPILGKTRYILAYVLTGIAGSMTSIGWHPLTISAGASGAIFGMYGVFLALLFSSVVEKATRRPLLISMIIFIVYNLMNGLKAQVDNAAHIGGLLCGILIGFIYIPLLLKNKKSTINDSALSIMCCPLLTIACSSLILFSGKPVYLFS